ncbi:hypothetical protein M514_02406 [Trichuris suis]|uniref:Uncharacterized protein n=1 Tax=Trichuris suis TaxID=68888 RepID=A0A085N5S3_9BILA|nr:hypothetical protein M514_02406 [Trichuris suis]
MKFSKALADVEKVISTGCAELLQLKQLRLYVNHSYLWKKGRLWLCSQNPSDRPFVCLQAQPKTYPKAPTILIRFAVVKLFPINSHICALTAMSFLPVDRHSVINQQKKKNT